MRASEEKNAREKAKEKEEYGRGQSAQEKSRRGGERCTRQDGRRALRHCSSIAALPTYSSKTVSAITSVMMAEPQTATRRTRGRRITTTAERSPHDW